MTSQTLGTDTLAVEVTNISSHGFWLFVKDKEYFLSYADYPWFKDAKISEILAVELVHTSHLFWEKLDIDLDIETLANPEDYPLIYK